MSKEMLEFHDPTASGAWFRPEGAPDGVKQIVVSRCPETGAQTSLSIWAPGTADTRVLSHELWEEVCILEGSMVCGGSEYTAGMVCIRPPRMPHGPFSTPKGCRMYEVYYSK